MPSYREDVHVDKIKEQTIKLDSLDNFKPINNSVLVRIDDRHDRITHGTLTLHLDTSFEPGVHAANKGTVIKVPDKYIYSEKPLPNTGEWDTEIEVQPGDQVWFDYLTGIECSKIECEDELYYVLPYHTLYMAKRKFNKIFMPADVEYIKDTKSGKITGKVIIDWDGEYVHNNGYFYRTIPLNGYVLCSPIIKEEGYKDFKFDREVAKYAMVSYAGSCNKKYRPSQNLGGKVLYYDDPEVQAGCKVLYGMPINLFLEQEEHSSFDGKKRFRIVQRRHLTAIMEN